LSNLGFFDKEFLAVGLLSIDADDGFSGKWTFCAVAQSKPAVVYVFATAPSLLDKLTYSD
jgi:hypothetical protein